LTTTINYDPETTPELRDYVKDNSFQIFNEPAKIEGNDLDYDREIKDKSPKCCCFIQPMDLSSGGSGYVLYLTMIQ